MIFSCLSAALSAGSFKIAAIARLRSAADISGTSSAEGSLSAVFSPAAAGGSLVMTAAVDSTSACLPAASPASTNDSGVGDRSVPGGGLDPADLDPESYDLDLESYDLDLDLEE